MDNFAEEGEPRRIDGQSVESEYSIEHPLKGKLYGEPVNARAMDLFSGSVRALQDGDQLKAGTLYQEALTADPLLHKHACDALTNLAKSCHPEEEGDIYYWLGIHTQYLEDYRQAESWYARSIDAFHNIGYLKREGRAHCNLGRLKIKHEDPSGWTEFKKAIELNPMDGIAHIDLGTAYYMIDVHERALDEFAEAVWADPQRYGPVVISLLQQYGNTWNEDMDKIGLRMAKKQGMDMDTLTAAEREAILQAYQYFEIGNGYFQSKRYKEALEQFEQGNLLSKKFPGNFLGVSLVIMQMIQVGELPGDQIPLYLEKADQNIDQCLRIAPNHLDYISAKKMIGEYKKKYHVL